MGKIFESARKFWRKVASPCSERQKSWGSIWIFLFELEVFLQRRSQSSRKRRCQCQCLDICLNLMTRNKMSMSMSRHLPRSNDQDVNVMSRHLPESNDQDTMSICDICLRNQERHVNFTTCGENYGQNFRIYEKILKKKCVTMQRGTQLLRTNLHFLIWAGVVPAETKPIEQEETMSMSMSRHYKSNDSEQNVNVNV